MPTLAKQITRIEALRKHTVDHGATEAEQESAAGILGRILMHNPDLAVIDRDDLQRRAEPEPARGDSDSVMELFGVQALRSTPKAILFWIPRLRRNEWIPRSQILAWNDDILEIPSWLWDAKAGGTR